MVSVMPASVFGIKISVTGIELLIKFYNIVQIFSPGLFAVQKVHFRSVTLMRGEVL
jgi:hypothetical protein